MEEKEPVQGRSCVVDVATIFSGRQGCHPLRQAGGL